jgi:hypothetical protein
MADTAASESGSDAALAGPEHVPDVAQAMRELRLHGTGSLGQWKELVGPLAAEIKARDEALNAKRSSATAKRWAGAGGALALAIVIGVFTHFVVGIAVFLAGVVVAIKLVPVPPPEYAGTERIEFVGKLVDSFGANAPNARLRLVVNLNASRGVPHVALPSGFGEATERGEREDAWMRGSLQGIPGLRLSWQATEWRTVVLRRKKSRGSRKVKIKEKAKMAYATRLAARLDADHALYALAPEPGKQLTGEAIDARKTPRGYTVRGWRDRAAKTTLASTDVLEALAGLREKNGSTWFGEPFSALADLMRSCEARLVERGAKGAA